MNLLFKAAALFLVSTSVFAATKNLESMKQDIEATKSVYSEECSLTSNYRIKSLASSNTKICLNESREIRKVLCARKVELISYLEAITLKKNISEVTQRFGEVPPPDSLGGVLLWQMKTSIDQVNATWSRQVDRMKLSRKCYSESANKSELKAELTNQTNLMKSELAQTILMVEANQ